jgi:hypothetical protein
MRSENCSAGDRATLAENPRQTPGPTMRRTQGVPGRSPGLTSINSTGVQSQYHGRDDFQFRRRLVARLAIVAIVFGQLAMTAYACPCRPQPRHSRRCTMRCLRTPSGGMRGMDAAPADAQGNACEVHCTNAIAADVHSDLPPVALVAIPVDVPALAALGASAGALQAALARPRGAPPVSSRFCRLLI